MKEKLSVDIFGTLAKRTGRRMCYARIVRSWHLAVPGVGLGSPISHSFAVWTSAGIVKIEQGGHREHWTRLCAILSLLLNMRDERCYRTPSMGAMDRRVQHFFTAANSFYFAFFRRGVRSAAYVDWNGCPNSTVRWFDRRVISQNMRDAMKQGRRRWRSICKRRFARIAHDCTYIKHYCGKYHCNPLVEARQMI